MTDRIILDVHALQTVPPSNLNRDDTGAPKTAVYGGVVRARVSSQAWKRATREHFEARLDPSEFGVRTKQLVSALGSLIESKDAGIGAADAALLAEAVLRTVIDGEKFKLEVPERKAKRAKESGEELPPKEASYLVFFSSRQLEGLAQFVVENRERVGAVLKAKKTSKDWKSVSSQAKKIANAGHSVDVSLFGRMVADASDINVDAACQVAHAISVHRAEIESDYFTAVDDRNPDSEPGAGMIGTVDFNSATLYRYAALDVDLLEKNLGQGLDEEEPATPVHRAVEAFLDGFISSLPTGKINTFGNHTLPDAVVVKLRTARPVSFASAFEKPVVADEFGGHVEAACARLADYVPELERAYGEDSCLTWVLRVGPATAKLASLGTETPSLSALVSAVGQAVADRAEQRR